MAKRKYNYNKNDKGEFECSCGKTYSSKRGYRNHCSKTGHMRINGNSNEDKTEPKAVIERITSSKTNRSKIIEEVQSAIRDFNKAKKRLSRKLEKVEYSSNAKYIAVLGISDLHYGNENVNMDYVEKIINFVKNNDSVYCFLNGDILDNWVEISPKGGNYEQVVEPKLQREIMIHNLKPIKDDILAIVTGNHEERSAKGGEENPTETIAKELEIPYLGAGGRINLDVNGNKYKIHIRHSYQYNSSFNPCHACGRLIEQLDSKADVVCIGHHHDPAVEVRFKAGKQRSLVRFGSAMPSTMYSESLGYGDTPLKAPTIIFSGEEFSHHPMIDIDLVKDYISVK